VELLGVNRLSDNFSDAIYNTTADNVLPWLQDTPQADVWTKWGVEYRDVVILDSSNRVAGVMNLTTYDLALSTNRFRLKELLRRAANGGDYDGDKLPDHWEIRYFGNLNATAAEDSDGDRYNNFLELTFATDPKDPTSFPRISLGFNNSKQFRISFDRWAGSASDYLVTTSSNLLDWSESTLNIRSSTTNYYDGTGRSRTTYNLVRSSTVQPSGVIRLNARP
jgi:hypothetical protein